MRSDDSDIYYENGVELKKAEEAEKAQMSPNSKVLHEFIRFHNDYRADQQKIPKKAKSAEWRKIVAALLLGAILGITLVGTSVGLSKLTLSSPEVKVNVECPNNLKTAGLNLTLTRHLIVRQDVKATPNVFNDSNYLSLNKDEEDAKMFSRLGDIEKFRNSDGKFHLKLCYDLATENCYEFRQSANPLDVKGDEDIRGVEVISRMFDDELPEQLFEGLRANVPSTTFLNGDRGTLTWFHAILTKQLDEGAIPVTVRKSGQVVRANVAQLFAITPY